MCVQDGVCAQRNGWQILSFKSQMESFSKVPDAGKLDLEMGNYRKKNFFVYLSGRKKLIRRTKVKLVNVRLYRHAFDVETMLK